MTVSCWTDEAQDITPEMQKTVLEREKIKKALHSYNLHRAACSALIEVAPVRPI